MSFVNKLRSIEIKKWMESPVRFCMWTAVRIFGLIFCIVQLFYRSFENAKMEKIIDMDVKRMQYL